MLNSYKDLSERWYSPLEPEPAAPLGPHPTEATGAAPREAEGPAQFPNYIRAEDEPVERIEHEAPTDLPADRAEFTGGWSDWIGRAPGPDDDYAAPGGGEVVRFPWPEDEPEDIFGSRPVTASRALRQEARDIGAARRKRALIVLVAVVLVLLAAAAAVAYLLADGSKGAGAAPTTLQFTAGSAPSGGDECRTEQGDGVLRSSAPGGTDSGPDAILAFQYAYYVERSGERARAAVAPDAPVSSAEMIQRGIDSVPAGASHCVHVTTITEGRYAVEVTVFRPGAGPTTYNRQIVTTAVIGGRALITGIAAG
ncbi:hypothetical protein D5S18_33820 [Nocardia panacis]|uniref:DUF8176 domain-containing protein n=1 Tax=Nocardia panacis TaxID=2340916 RepID=A0A3A4K8Y5_9NOCA|nr:hypothetical protein [Nocardia panacis]RJO68388.1 hypothetical protein D5S18_33820 [Nocardia panacis]